MKNMSIVEKMKRYAKIKIEMKLLSEELTALSPEILNFVKQHGKIEIEEGSFYIREEYAKRYTKETETLIKELEELKVKVKHAIAADTENKKVKLIGKPKISLNFREA